MKDNKKNKKNKKMLKFNFKNIFNVNSSEETNKRIIVIAFVLGLALGLTIMAFFIPDRIAKLSNGEEVIVTIGEKNITADELYKDMKQDYSIDLLLNKIDDTLLNDLYPTNNDIKKEVNDMADYYISMYETYYGYSEEKFLESNNFKNKDEFLKTLTLEYKRNEYFNDYLKKLVTDSEIDKYYNEIVTGDIEAKYILVDNNKEDNKTLADKIITRLNNNEKYDEIVKHYGERISTKDLGFVSYNNDLSQKINEALKSLKDGEYTKTAVEENGKYYIIFRTSTKEKKALDEMKDDIIKEIIEQKKKDNQNLYYQCLNELRMTHNVKFSDTELEKKYEEYIKLYEN